MNTDSPANHSHVEPGDRKWFDDRRDDSIHPVQTEIHPMDAAQIQLGDDVRGRHDEQWHVQQQRSHGEHGEEERAL